MESGGRVEKEREGGKEAPRRRYAFSPVFRSQTAMGGRGRFTGAVVAVCTRGIYISTMAFVSTDKKTVNKG